MTLVRQTITRLKIDTNSSGNTSLVPADANRKIRVLNYILVAGGDVNVKFTDGAGGSDLSGAMPLTTNSGVSATADDAYGLLQTSKNTALVLNLSGAVQVSGHITCLLTS